MYSSFFLSMFFYIATTPFSMIKFTRKTFQKESMYSDKFRIRFWFVYDKSRFVRRYEDNRYKDDPNIISPRKSLEALYREIKKQHKEIDVIVTTGYGRNLLDQADFKITEITCHAAGAFFMNPVFDTIIDIGGQDSKVITIDDLGCVTDFLMNDKCAAGTGRFLEMTMKRVESEIGRIGTFLKDSKPAKINSMCAVFAESEIVRLFGTGYCTW